MNAALPRFLAFLSVCLSTLLATACTPPPGMDDAAMSPLEPGWQRYINADAGFSIDYPEDWSLQTMHYDNADQMQGVAVAGAEGVVELQWGTGFGGACPEGRTTVTTAEEELDACYIQEADGTDRWEQIYRPIDDDTTFGARAYTLDTTASGRERVLEVLGTLRFE